MVTFDHFRSEQKKFVKRFGNFPKIGSKSESACRQYRQKQKSYGKFPMLSFYFSLKGPKSENFKFFFRNG